jgi:glycogen debranching enzyme
LANGRISFEVAIKPGQVWHTCVEYSATIGTHRYAAPKQCIAQAHSSELGKPLEQWCNTVLKVHTSNQEFERLYRQAVEDMAALRLPVGGTHHLEFTPAAWIPWFVALFGRDTLIAALQNTHIYPDFSRGALDVLGQRQATETDDYRDQEPGKIQHEMRYGELAHLKLIPHAPYFGTADATPLYLILLHTAWRSTGNRELVERHLGNAERCLEWIDRYGDRDGDGFQEYETRSPAGYANQSWKASGDSVIYPNGSLVKGPKALCELQGYVFDAWTRMAEIYDFFDKPERAEALRKKARLLFERFNEVFWDEDSGFYAYCLDGDKQKVLNRRLEPGPLSMQPDCPQGAGGPCRLPPDAARYVERLGHADPIGAQSGLQPVIIPERIGLAARQRHYRNRFQQYGFTEEAARIARAVTDAGSYFALYRMPELYAGIEREDTNFPVQYPDANVPQAWAAGSIFSLLQALIGLEADASGWQALRRPGIARLASRFAAH